MFNTIAKLILEQKKIVIFLVVFLFVLAFAGCFFVSVNYNLTDYLPDSAQSSKATKISVDEFGYTSSSEVMIKNISAVEANSIKNKISKLKGIRYVYFYNTSDYFKNVKENGRGDALIKFYIRGEESSEAASNTLNDITAILDKENRTYTFSGDIFNSQQLQSSIQKQMFLFVGAFALVMLIILAIYAKSNFEIVIYGVIIIFSFVINEGSSYLIKNIPYIILYISHIIQLALSLGLSFLVIDKYHKNKIKNKNVKENIQGVLSCVLKPIFILFTIIILPMISLFFMKNSIGVIVYITLIKTITCSFVCAILLLPNLVLIFSNSIEKYEKKNTKRENNTNFKNIKILSKLKYICPVLLILIIGGSCFLSTLLKISYSDYDILSKNNEAVKIFGENNTLNLLLPYASKEDDFIKQNELIEFIKTFKTEDGEQIYKNSLTYSSETLDEVSLETASEMFNMDIDILKQLYGMYYVDNNLIENDKDKMNLSEFIYLLDDICNGSKKIPLDIGGSLGNMGETTSAFRFIIDLLDEELTAGELAEKLQEKSIKNIIDLSFLTKDYILQIYGLYNYEHGVIVNEKISLKNLVNYIADIINEKEDIKTELDLNSMLDLNSINTILAFNLLLNSFHSYMSVDEVFELFTNLSKIGFALDGLEKGYIQLIYGMYYYNYNLLNTTNIIMGDLVEFIYNLAIGKALSKTGIDLYELLNDEVSNAVKAFHKLLEVLKSNLNYKEFANAMKATEFRSITDTSIITEEQIKIVYSWYHYKEKNMVLNEMTITEILAKFQSLINIGFSQNSIINQYFTLIRGIMSSDSNINMNEKYTLEEANAIFANNNITIPGIGSVPYSYVLAPDYVELCYVINAFELQPIHNTERLLARNMLHYIVNDIIDSTKPAYNSVIAGAIPAEATNIITTCVKIHDDSLLNFNYDSLTDTLNDYLYNFGITEVYMEKQIMQQVYILYFIDFDMLPNENIEFIELLNYIKNLITRGNSLYDDFIARFIEDTVGKESFNDFKYVLELANIICSQMDIEVNYLDMAVLLNNYMVILGDDLTFNKDLLQFIYILYFDQNNLLPIDKLAVYELSAYLRDILMPSSTSYNTGIATLIESYLGESDITIENLVDLLALTDSIQLAKTSDLTYKQMSKELNKYLSLFNLNFTLDEKVVEQIYILNIIENDYMPNIKIKAITLITYLYGLAISSASIQDFIGGKAYDNIINISDSLDKSDMLFNGGDYSKIILILNTKANSNETFKFIDNLRITLKEWYGDSAVIEGNSVEMYDLKNFFERDIIIYAIIMLSILLVASLLLLSYVAIACIITILNIGIINITLAIIYLFSMEISYIAIIISTFTLIGITTAFSLLIINQYLNNRKTKCQKESAYCTVINSLGLLISLTVAIVVACSLNVFLSKSLAVANISLIVGIGSIISALVSITILPQVLLVLDKFFNKTNILEKNQDENKKSNKVTDLHLYSENINNENELLNEITSSEYIENANTEKKQ